jgi:hypothetical protein
MRSYGSELHLSQHFTAVRTLKGGLIDVLSWLSTGHFYLPQ